MSIERPQHNTTQGDPEYRIPAVPDHAPEYAEKPDDFSEKSGKKGPNWLKRSIALGAAAATLTAGLFVGVKAFGGHDGPSKEGQRPVATAPATPGQTHETTAPHETAPSAPSAEVAGSWSESNVPILLDLNGDGKLETYTGVTAAEKAMALSSGDYATSEDAAKAFVSHLNAYVNFGNNPTAQTEYTNYTSHINTGGMAGAEAVGYDYLSDVFEKSLTSDHEEGVSIQGDVESLNKDFINSVPEALRQAAGARYYLSTQPGVEGQPYKLTVEAVSTQCQEGVATAAPENCTIVIRYHDNFSETGIGKMQQDAATGDVYTPLSGTITLDAAMQKQQATVGGANGEYWFMTGVTTEGPVEIGN